MPQCVAALLPHSSWASVTLANALTPLVLPENPDLPCPDLPRAKASPCLLPVDFTESWPSCVLSGNNENVLSQSESVLSPGTIVSFINILLLLLPSLPLFLSPFPLYLLFLLSPPCLSLTVMTTCQVVVQNRQTLPWDLQTRRADGH